jgi:hypothetical protein
MNRARPLVKPRRPGALPNCGQALSVAAAAALNVDDLLTASG